VYCIPVSASRNSRRLTRPPLVMVSSFSPYASGEPSTEDARDAGDHDRVPARKDIARRGQAQLVQIVVPRRVLLDVDVPLGDVRLGLVVVVVADEVVDGVVGQELLEFLEELGREGLIVRDKSAWAYRPAR